MGTFYNLGDMWKLGGGFENAENSGFTFETAINMLLEFYKIYSRNPRLGYLNFYELHRNLLNKNKRGDHTKYLFKFFKKF